jgi:hypothetical protein
MFDLQIKFTVKAAKVKYSELPLRSRMDITRLSAIYAAARWSVFNKMVASSFDSIRPTEEGTESFSQLAVDLLKYIGIDVKKVGDISLQLNGNRNLVFVIEHTLNTVAGLHYCSIHCLGTNTTIQNVLSALMSNSEPAVDLERFNNFIDFPQNNEDLIPIISVESKNLQ